ncbi:MAG: AAA family ATPase, partial [Bacteroidetes bacterium]|nr:AAA family ATPase [Bacteroidota bacterium]
MKILNLKFRNINSLSGENEIDFTRPDFTNDGLFAITGKTGAGKSSILDAISLAFYGKTPRVDITGSENAVMTRGEKD